MNNLTNRKGLGVISVFLLMVCFFVQTAIAKVPFWYAVAIDDGSFDQAFGVYAADIDGDGRMDVLGASVINDDITWWRNDGCPSCSVWDEYTIDGNFDYAISVHAADVDGDGDMDVLGAAPGTDDVSWFENNGTPRDDVPWVEHALPKYSTPYDPWFVYGTDLDDDDDIDIVASYNAGGRVVCWENTDGDGTMSAARDVGPAPSSYTAYPADLDGDDDLDLISACFGIHHMYWFKNDGTPFDGGWAKTNLDLMLSNPSSAHAADIDGDGKMDVIGSMWSWHDIFWWRNNNGLGTDWTRYAVETSFANPHSVYAADLDNDGDMDIIAAGATEQQIAWWENDGSPTGVPWDKHVLGTGLVGRHVYADDIDGDGDIDVVAACGNQGIVWFRNDTPKYGGGDGTAENPFIISDYGDMWDLEGCTSHWDNHFILANDISLPSWLELDIGTSTTNFTGVFDGDGHVIAGFTYNPGYGERTGLFGHVGTGGQIKNLGLVDVEIHIGLGDYAGCLAAINNGTISNCYATGTVIGDRYVGGLVGYNNAGTITNCYVTAGIAGGDRVGSLCGYNNGTVSYCYAAGHVIGTSNKGGLVGYDSGGSYTACFWGTETAGQPTGVGNIGDPAEVRGRTTIEMKTQATFTDYGWDFIGETSNGTDDDWVMFADGTYYPELTWRRLRLTGERNLIQNPGFELDIDPDDGWADCWEPAYEGGNAVIRSGGAHSGSHYLELSVDDSPGDNWSAAYQLGFPADERQKYVVSVYAKRGASYNGGSRIELGWHSHYDYDSEVGWDQLEFTATDTWEEYSFSAIAPAGANYLFFILVSWGTDSDSVTLFDDISLRRRIVVDEDAPGNDNGVNWTNAFRHLHDGLDAALWGDEIRVAEGTYKPDKSTLFPGGSGDPDATFQLQSTVEVYGGYAGYGTPSPNARNIALYETILNGDIGVVDDPCDNSYHVVTGSGTDETAVFDGFTITAGNASGTFPNDNAVGGGMYNYGGSPTVTDCTFIGNSAYQGGGMWNQDHSSTTLTNCTFSGNSAYDDGGGMYNNNSNPTVMDCTFTGNSAKGSHGYGGGMFNFACKPTLTNCIFSGNLVNHNGGGMYSDNNSSATLTNCTFTGNSAGEYGGGMYTSSIDTIVTNSIIWGNSAPTESQIFGPATVSYSDIQGGWAGAGGNNISADPEFVDPNGADGIIGTEDDDLRLSAGSACNDAGDNTAVPGGVTSDLDGRDRFMEDPYAADTGNGTPPIVDMGAYEFDLEQTYPGSGTEGAPYLISSPDHLVQLAVYPDDWDKHFLVTADIDMSGYDGQGGNPSFNIIGNTAPYFTGVFDGDGHTISNFTYTSTGTSYIGLFGYVGSAEIKDLGLTDPNVNAGTGDYVGALVGYNSSGTVSNCYATGSVTGDNYVGALVGYNSSGTVSNCYATGTVTGDDSVGGLVGYSSSSGTVSNCYATGTVTGDNYVGGLAGRNYGTVSNCYATGPVSGPSNAGGLIGYGYGTVYLCYWDTQTSGQSNSAGGTGKSTTQMISLETYRGWGYGAAWTIDDGNYCPRLVWEGAEGELIIDEPRYYDGGDGDASSPYEISTAEHLGGIGYYRDDFDKHFIVTADIDMFDYDPNYFNTIGNTITEFTGSFDGDGHTISNFTYTSTGGYYIGLFGRVGSAEIKNLGMVNVDIDAWSRDYVGALVGYNLGTISNCYATGSVTGDDYVGGLAGWNGDPCYPAIIGNCYATGSVTGDYCVGGLVGRNYYGTVSNCYAAGAVDGTSNEGGLVGYDGSGSYTASFWDKTVNAHLIGAGDGVGNIPDPCEVIGETTGNMQKQTTFTDEGWDFVSEASNGTDNYWRLCVDDVEYPKLGRESIMGDIACPDGVSLFDFAFAASRWLEEDCEYSNDCGGADMDTSNIVDMGDAVILAERWMAGL